MAFQSSQAPAAVTGNNTNWQATAWLNVYLPKAGGGRTKVGAIPLKAGRKFDAALIKRLSEDEGAAEVMAGMIEIDFQLTDDPKAPAPVLPF